MKFSKESHRKTGVGIVKNNGPEGLLYKDPNTGEEYTIEKIVRDRADSTKRLFNLFGEVKNAKDISEGAKEIAKGVNRAIDTLKRNKKKNKEEEITGKLDVTRLYDEINNSYHGNASESALDEALNGLLKKSFRTKETKSALRTLLMCSIVNKKPLSKEQQDIIQKSFVKKLVEEYNKTKEKERTPKALRNQNLVVQPVKGSAVLTVSETPKSASRKTVEKDAFRGFITEYATLDDETRHNYRVKLRRLIDLYFYGAEAVNPYDFNEWEDHETKKANIEAFVKPIKQEKKAKSGITIEKIDVDSTRDAIREKNISCYRKSIDYVKKNASTFFEDGNLNEFWIHHIENEVERIYSRLNSSTEDYKLCLGYLSEKAWKGIINYLSIKYIAIGKAVYNFAMSELSSESERKAFGKLNKEFANGISSFEYEIIKAEETLQRECAVNVAFAANHLANATVELDEKETDFLTVKELENYAKPNTLKNILQFFGGESAWEGFDFGLRDETELLYDFQKIVYSLRNSSFHFKTENIDNSSWNADLIGKMFEHECQKAGMVQKDKFYSNNVPVYYSEKSIEKLLNTLYSRYNERASQVPSFNAVFVRKTFPDYLLKTQKISPKFSTDDLLKWQSAVYYIYKEIYYNAFLQDEKSFKLLKQYVKALDDRCNDKQKAGANKSFKDAFELYSKSNSLSATCQMIMTEYNNQNKGNRRGISSRSGKDTEVIFQHYKMILFDGLRSAFTEYLKENADVYGFIGNPAINSNLPEAESFLTQYTSPQYNDLIAAVQKDAELLKWYIVGRLLSAKQVNQLIGSFRSYEQYVNDVARRARETGNSLVKHKLSIDVKKVIRALDICTKLNGNTSNTLTDYFDGKSEYAEYISNFVDFGLKNEGPADGYLAAFCDQEINGQKVGIYHDGTNPIINRNVVLCKLYGTSDVIINSDVKTVDKNTLKRYIEGTDKIKDYRKTGTCTSKETQMELNRYQALKNRIELRSIVDYSELINELQGQLINWVYLRERDLMYFQLGFHYMCLQNNVKKPEGYESAGDYSGAILYQIVAMYTNGLPMLSSDGKAKSNKTASTGTKIGAFLDYSKEFVNGDKEAVYNAGLELFENVNEHDQYTELRNYIEHFKYYAKHDRSMLDIYSEVFDRFFTYDMKYAKNVTNMLYNILLRHLAIPSFAFATGSKVTGNKGKVTKERATIALKAENGLASEKFTFKLNGGEQTVKLCARDDDYLFDIAALLYYPDKPPVGVVRKTDAENEKARSGDDSRKSTGNWQEKVSSYKTESKPAVSPFAAALAKAQERKRGK